MHWDYLKDGDDRPEQRVEVLAPAFVTTVRQHFAELTAEQIHAQYAGHRTQHILSMDNYSQSIS